MKAHGERKHSKFSASGAERWMKCPGSVALSEGQPDQDSVWSIEGTKAHEVLEALLLEGIDSGSLYLAPKLRGAPTGFTLEMVHFGEEAANFIMQLHRKTQGSEIAVETRIHLDFIHPEMFGTFDGAVIDHFGTLHVFDYKYGAGHAVSPKGNLQMIFYGLGLAQKYDWNFAKVRLWIIQPRIKGYDGPAFWEIPIHELKAYVPVFTEAVKRVEENPTEFVEGGHCHWCKAKKICPLKVDKRNDHAIELFKQNPLKGETHAKGSTQKSSEKEECEQKIEAQSESDWRQESRKTKARKKEKSQSGRQEEKSQTQRRDDDLDFF